MHAAALVSLTDKPQNQGDAFQLSVAADLLVLLGGALTQIWHGTFDVIGELNERRTIRLVKREAQSVPYAGPRLPEQVLPFTQIYADKKTDFTVAGIPRPALHHLFS